MKPALTREQLLRLVRMYKTQADAGDACGCRGSSIARALKREGIRNPWKRKGCYGDDCQDATPDITA